MGKVRKLRQKYHLSRTKSNSQQNLPEVNNAITGNELDLKKNFFKSSENIFAGVDISFDELEKSLPKDIDACSVITSKSRKELKEEERFLKKKERRKLRHGRFLQKLEIAYSSMQKAKSKKKSQKKVLGDMNGPPKTPTLLTPIKNVPIKRKPEITSKPKGILKAKNRLKQQASDLKMFKKILENKKFKTNPMETVSNYLKQKISDEN